MKIDIKLDVFEGPLDLLLHLIEKNKVSIYDIPIVEITNQYMEYIREMEKTYSMESMSEFLVMAATLLKIKSKMLLPQPEKEEEEDPREELVRRLTEYKMYKYAAEELKAKNRHRACINVAVVGEGCSGSCREESRIDQRSGGRVVRICAVAERILAFVASTR